MDLDKEARCSGKLVMTVAGSDPDEGDSDVECSVWLKAWKGAVYGGEENNGGDAASWRRLLLSLLL